MAHKLLHYIRFYRIQYSLMVVIYDILRKLQQHAAVDYIVSMYSQGRRKQIWNGTAKDATPTHYYFLIIIILFTGGLEQSDGSM